MFIELEVKLGIIIHGYTAENKEIEEHFNEVDFIRKIVAIERIQSISERYVLVKASHDRLIYWEYKGSMAELKQRMLEAGIKIA